jgi:GNAT superfamily N-acetyltransferase
MSFLPTAMITAADQVESFDCGKESLNQYLRRFALTNTAAGTARTYVTTSNEEPVVLGYYSLAAGSAEKAIVPDRVAKGVPNHPIPVVLLARLAVDGRFQGKGIGKGLLRDALVRTVAAAEVVGVRAIVVHAKDEGAARFYSQFGFTRSPTDSFHLMLLIKDLRRTLPT